MCAMRSDYLILKRRAQEQERRVYEETCKTNQKIANNAIWEIKTSATIDSNTRKGRFDAIRRSDQEALHERRRKLAAMLAAEQLEFEEQALLPPPTPCARTAPPPPCPAPTLTGRAAAQLDRLEETPVERRARMEARATELKAKREAERQAFVATQYERQWRLACDPLREQDSQLIVKATTAARAYQIGEKMRQLEREEQESRAFDDLWEKDRLAKLGREEAEASQRMQMDAAQKAVLDRQVAELHAYREMEKDLAEQEAQMMKEQALIEEEESRNVEAHRAAFVASAHRELVDFNEQKIAAVRSAAATEKAADSARLNAALEREAALEAKEAAARRAMQDETKLFGAHMLAQKRQIAAREKEQDELQQKELDKAWDKRLAVWGAEQEARERLMAQVLDERRIQVLTKVDQVRVERQKMADARVKLEAEMGRINEIQAAKDRDAHATRMHHRQLLETQMKEKAFAKAAAEHNKAQEKLMAERAEAQYQTMLNAQLSKTQSQMQKFTMTS